MGRNSFMGRQTILDKLERIRRADKLGQPFLLAGPEGSGKENTALEFARRLNCAAPDTCTPAHRCESCVKTLSFQHPDIRWIGPAPAAVAEQDVQDLFAAKMANPFFQPPWAATAQISIGDPENPGPLSVRSIIHFLRRRAFQSPYKVAIIADGHRLNLAAANAFLKTLEEPPPDTVIFLLTVGTEGMLPTIVSRCQKIRFEPWPEDELVELLQEVGEVGRDRALQVARTADGNARRGLSSLQPGAQMVSEWARRLFCWIHEGDRALCAVAADELHRGQPSHACLPAGVAAKSFEAKEPALRRDRAMQLCELLNLHYSDTIGSRELGADWRPRLTVSAELTGQVSRGRSTASLLADLERIEVARREVDRNINIGLVMAVMLEGLIENAERDRTRQKAGYGA